MESQLPRGLVRRLIETGERRPRVCRLKLRIEVPVAAFLLAENAAAVLLLHLAGVPDGHDSAALRHHGLEAEPDEIVSSGHNLRLEIHAAGFQDGALNLQLLLVEPERLQRLHDLHPNIDLAGKRSLFRVERQIREVSLRLDIFDLGQPGFRRTLGRTKGCTHGKAAHESDSLHKFSFSLNAI